MCLNLNEYQFKISKYIYRLTYMTFTVTTNQKSTINTKKKKKRKRKIPKHNAKEKHQTTMEEIKRRRN